MIRVNDLARELGIKSREILNVLLLLGVTTSKSYASSLNDEETSKIRAHFHRGAKNVGNEYFSASHDSEAPQTPSLKKSHISTLGHISIRRSYIQQKVLASAPQIHADRDAIISSQPRPKAIRKNLAGKGSASEQKGTCPICNRRVDPNMLQKHINRNHRKHDGSFKQKLGTCPVCRCNVSEKNLKGHIEEVHPTNSDPRKGSSAKKKRSNLRTYGLPVRIVTVQQPQLRHDARISCRVNGCSAMVFPHAMKRHIENIHSEKKYLQLQNLSTGSFPFILLPPGTWEFREVLEHYSKRLHSRPHGFVEQAFDWDRIVQIGSLNPKLRHFGVKSWFGYAVYEFSYSDRVVLECPVEGNATYVLSGDWKRMIYRTKAMLRREYAKQCTRIVHKGDWLHRIRMVL